MLSPFARGITFGLALYYLALGTILFFIPGRTAEVFAWKVSPFVTMTIGGWCLGNAWLAWIAAWRWRWAQNYASLVYLWVFGVLEAAVALAFNDKLRLEHPIAWLYLGTLGFNLLAALAGLAEWVRKRPSLDVEGKPIQPFARFFVILFIVVVGFLGAYGLVARQGWPATNGGIFPEVLSPFTLHSFGAFYLSLALGAVTLLFAKRMPPFLTYAFSAYGLIVAITMAAFWFLEAFDFKSRPGGLIYLGIYFAVGLVILVYFLRYGTGKLEPGEMT